MVGLVIGRGGDKIKELQDRSGASIQVRFQNLLLLLTFV